VNREELEHVLRAAGEVVNAPHFIVIGSQSVLGSFPEDRLPYQATRSIEVDIVVADDPDETKMGLIDRNIGEDSEFHRMHGMYAEGVALTTAVLPEGWQKRLVRFQPPTLYPVQALCLEPHDCVASKMVARRSKDYEFANAMLAQGLVSPGTLGDRIDLLPITGREKNLLHQWLRGQTGQLKRSSKNRKSP
jgi:hypothetical protein